MNMNGNNLAYLKLILSASIETVTTNKFNRKNRNQFERDLEELSIFFIFSLGRSGTQFLARMLNNDVTATVCHEPAKRDVLEYVKSFRDDYSCKAYIQGFRKNFIRYKVANKKVRTYGEVNSYLRRHAPSIIECIPSAIALFLIRDGRDVVRSMMSRGVFSDNWFYNRIIPSQSDSRYRNWEKWGSFEKCCWFWASENALLTKEFGNAFKFEKMISDYEYFATNVTNRLHLDIGEAIWAREIGVKSENRTSQYKIDSYEEWPKKWQEVFWEICGEMMERHGYV